MNAFLARLRRHLGANPISYVACFVALGGTASAAVVITNNNQVAPGVIAGAKATSSQTNNVIANSIGSAEVADGGVGAADIANNAADTYRVLDGGIATADVAPAGLTSPNLGYRVVTPDKLGADTRRRIDFTSGPVNRGPLLDLGSLRLWPKCWTDPLGTVRMTVQFENLSGGRGLLTASYDHGSGTSHTTDLKAIDPGPSLDYAMLFQGVTNEMAVGTLDWRGPSDSVTGVFDYTVDASHCEFHAGLVRAVA
jgi:hypothetical protein